MTPRTRSRIRTPLEANIRSLMARKGITTYKKLARAADIHTSTIQRICSGDAKPSLDTLLKIATALNCKVDDLLT